MIPYRQSPVAVYGSKKHVSRLLLLQPFLDIIGELPKAGWIVRAIVLPVESLHPVGPLAKSLDVFLYVGTNGSQLTGRSVSS
jgi:hypothetical protein